MQIKKSRGKVFGASLTSAEKKAMDMEIQRQLIEYDRKNAREIDAIVLWELVLFLVVAGLKMPDLLATF